jgi:hypothetical protein
MLGVLLIILESVMVIVLIREISMRGCYLFPAYIRLCGGGGFFVIVELMLVSMRDHLVSREGVSMSRFLRSAFAVTIRSNSLARCFGSYFNVNSLIVEEIRLVYLLCVYSL